MRKDARLNLRLYRDEVKALRRVARITREKPTTIARTAVVEYLRRVEQVANPTPPLAV